MDSRYSLAARLFCLRYPIRLVLNLEGGCSRVTYVF